MKARSEHVKGGMWGGETKEQRRMEKRRGAVVGLSVGEGGSGGEIGKRSRGREVWEEKHRIEVEKEKKG